jgi:hypothetical protein
MFTTTMMVFVGVALVFLGGLIAVIYSKYYRGESLDDRLEAIADRATASAKHDEQCASITENSIWTFQHRGEEERGGVARPRRWELAALWLHERYERIIIKLKIVIVTIQVVTSVPGTLAVSMPKSFTHFVDGFRFLNLSLTAAFPVTCSRRITFIDELIMTTCAPLAIVLILVIAMVVECAYHEYLITGSPHRKTTSDVATKCLEVKGRYLNYVFYLSYLVMPSVTTTIFATFICTSIDPDGETGGSDGDERYLAADMSISCSSDYYWGGVMYACAMIVVYPGE